MFSVFDAAEPQFNSQYRQEGGRMRQYNRRSTPHQLSGTMLLDRLCEFYIRGVTMLGRRADTAKTGTARWRHWHSIVPTQP